MTKRSPELCELEVEFTGRETDKAYQIRIDGFTHWLPFSQTEERHGALQGGPGRIVISAWIAREKNLA